VFVSDTTSISKENTRNEKSQGHRNAYTRRVKGLELVGALIPVVSKLRPAGHIRHTKSLQYFNQYRWIRKEGRLGLGFFLSLSSVAVHIYNNPITDRIILPCATLLKDSSFWMKIPQNKEQRLPVAFDFVVQIASSCAKTTLFFHSVPSQTVSN